MPLSVLKKYWGYDTFRPCQLEIVESVLAGRDTIGLLPTGGGKSITFQVPAMLLPGITLVVTPLISLMKDQVDNLSQRGIGAAMIHSGMTAREINYAFDRCLYGRVKVLYVSPERLSREAFRVEMRQWEVSMIVVDEAHCISQWGYDFRPSYLSISELRKVLPGVPVLALTASATPEVVKDIAEQLLMNEPAIFVRSFTRPNLSYIVRHDEHKLTRLEAVLRNTSGSAIVYVRSRRKSAEICSELQRMGFSAQFYHAGLPTDEKNFRQDQWKTGQVRIMVATNAFGMGIDKPDVRVVVHTDLPSSLEEYYQEAGRAGRDGLHSFAVLLVSKVDKGVLKRRLGESFPPRDFLVDVYNKLCVFLDVAMGDGYNRLYEFSLDAFCTRYSLPPIQTESALNILTRAGYIEYADDSFASARIMMLAKKSELYEISLDEKTDRILQVVLRRYTGLFADYVDISETLIASLANVTPNDVYQAMLLLTRMHVLHYIPKRMLPYVYFTTSREDGRYLVFPKSVYADQRERMKRRLDIMARYAFDDSECRNSKIISYFGEEPECECGHCDVCRSRRKKGGGHVDMETHVLGVLRSNREHRVGVSALATSAPGMDEAIAGAVRSLAEKGMVRIDGGTVSLI